MAIMSLKTNEYYQTPLFEMYYYTTKCSHLNDEELKEYFCSAFIPFTHTLPKVTDTLKLKGNLRISWSFDINYNKNIDLIFFPEENPYINYAVLFAKDFKKSFVKDVSIDRELNDITIPYNINYDFVKEILSQSDLSKVQQERFFEVRFGSVFVPMEITFKWYYLSTNFEYNSGKMIYPKHNKEASFSFLVYENIVGTIADIEVESAELCLGIIKSHQVLPKEIVLNFPDSVENWNYDSIEGSFSYTEIFTPLPTAALATTQTNIGDYLVNVRDKPDTKEGKIVTQLLSQKFSYDLLQPKFKKLQEENGWEDEATFVFIEEMQEHYKTKQAYFKKEKANLINPLNFNEYLILVWNIEPNNWAKVWILKMIRDKDWIMVDKYDSNEKEKIYFKDEKKYTFDNNLIVFINSSYAQTFLESSSTLKLYEGYIHCSGLKYLTPFTENYIKR